MMDTYMCLCSDVVYVIKSLWMSEHALHFNHSWIEEVLLAVSGVGIYMYQPIPAQPNFHKCR